MSVLTDMIARWKNLARKLELETYTLYYASRNPGTPWYAKVWVALVVAYALSPVDLIPDFIPVIGYLDDLVLIPAGVAVAIKLIPKDVYAASKSLAQRRRGEKKPNWVVGGIVIAVWVGVAALIGYAIIRKLRR
jgi:uncharacterized membrane protein YkvA (DUF1232 family)